MKLDKCPITGLDVINHSQVDYNHSYSIENYSTQKYFFITEGCCNEKFIIDNQHIFRSLFLQNRFPYLHPKLITPNDLKTLLREGNYPKTPKAKLDELLLGIFRVLEWNSFASSFELTTLINSFFFKNRNELSIYLKALEGDRLIELESVSEQERLGIKLTFKGINYASSLMQNGSTSKRAFIAMSFGEKCEPIREAIKQACTETNYQPILIDEVHIDNESTINDAIIAEIKQAKFCISDFTEQKDGVYFEAGYALGRGLPVIYTCQEEDFKNTHFDTNHFPHILYKNTECLKRMLIDKIKAWIE